MSIQDIINSISQHNYILIIIFFAIPLLAYLGVLLQGRTPCKDSKIKYLFSILVYLACIPGIFSAVLTGYVVFFLRGNLLRVNFLVYILPIISMIATLLIIKKKNTFDDIPGFDRILGLMLLIGISFAVSLLAYRTIVIIAFFGGFANLLLIAALVFIFLKIATAKLMKK